MIGAGLVAHLGGEKRGGEVYAGFLWGNLIERSHLDDLEINWWMRLKWILKNWDGGMSWIDLAQDMDLWRVLVNAVMNLRIP